jgi:signal transduction histidine kinase
MSLANASPKRSASAIAHSLKIGRSHQGMSWRRHKRQFLLFLTAILLPATLLIGLAFRVIRQEAELAETRTADEQRRAIEQARWELSARLEAIKLQEINRRIRTPDRVAAGKTPDSAVVLVAPIDGDHLELPWKSDPKPSPPSSDFVKHRQEGEALEFRDRDITAAIGVYRRALDAARGGRDRCESRLLLARALVKAARTAGAAAMYRAMLKDCGSATDEDGIPFRLYAAERLINARLDPAIAFESLIVETQLPRWHSPLASHLMRSLLSTASDELGMSAHASLVSRIHTIERLDALDRDFPKVRAAIESVTGADSVWLAYGNEPWLVGIAPPFAFVISSRHVAPRGTTLIAGHPAEGAWLGHGFLNLSVEWDPSPFAQDTGRIPVSLFAAGVALILGMTILGGYLLLRDVNRDLRMAEMRSHFVANVSHELKTPLTAIRMFADTLVLRPSADERMQAEYLQTITNESERLTRLVDNVLEFSKIEQGRKIYQMRPASLPEVVRSAARAMRYPLSQQGFTLHVSIDESVPSVRADSDALEQAILNLLSNALKYSGDAREIDLRLTVIDGEAAIDVTDRGLGIPAEDHERIFEKFYRVQSTQTECIAGTGLGLTLVQHIAQSHGGRIEVRSTAGQGSTFSLRIPFK